MFSVNEMLLSTKDNWVTFSRIPRSDLDLDLFVITCNNRLISYAISVSLTSILRHVVDDVLLTSSL